MVFYFSATGNSLYAARYLDEDAVSIPQVIHRKNLTFQAERIGICAPVYGHEMPQMVKEFIRKATFDTDYLYLILTYGNRHANAVELAENVLSSAGKKAAYIRTLLMVDNFLPAFDMEQQCRLDKHVDEQLEAIRSDILSGRREIEYVSAADRQAHENYLKGVRNQPETVWASFDFTDTCIGCGICTRVCPAGCIHLEDGRAVRTGKNCQACMACIQACPEMAIRMNPVLGFKEPNPNARYRNEHVSLTDLVRANWQKKEPESISDMTNAVPDDRMREVKYG
jgi:ferredoxin